MHLRLRAPVVPAVRGQPVRRQRFLPLLARLREHPLRPAAVRQPGHRPGRELVGRSEHVGRHRHICLVLHRGEIAGAE